MTAEEMKKEFEALYTMMANSNKVEFMHTFGKVHKEMMEWFIQNKPEMAQEWIEKLESIKWRNYLAPKEAQKIVDGMVPKAPWSRDQWKAAMEKEEFPLEKEPSYNRCALYVTMSMIHSDSSETLSKYVENEDLFEVIHSLAVDKLTDADGKFNVREYFRV